MSTVPDRPAAEQPTVPSFGSWMGSMWLFTALRFGLFFVLWGLLTLVGLRGFVGALFALLLSVPLSFVLLARPRHAFARNLEARIAARTVQRDDLDSRLDPDALDPDSRDDADSRLGPDDDARGQLPT